ncbi:MAG: hypothetical protein EBR82_14240 [Caulobacteraceae bacterium]|nr:hypothetical protein [Caulobacteraceae bacterium]
MKPFSNEYTIEYNMDTQRYYKEKSTGKPLGQFMFASAMDVAGAYRGRLGTLYFFRIWDDTVIAREYTEFYDLQNPEVPPDIEVQT